MNLDKEKIKKLIKNNNKLKKELNVAKKFAEYFRDYCRWQRKMDGEDLECIEVDSIGNKVTLHLPWDDNEFGG